MRIQHSESVEAQRVEMEGASGCRVRWLIGTNDGAPNFAMRQFTVEPGGYTPRHSHPYEHEVYVLEGNGEVYGNNQSNALRAGDVILVPPDEVHQFRNNSDAPLTFLCLIPNSAASQKVTVAPECGTES